MNTKIYSDASILNIRSHFDSVEQKYITYPKFVFLCGKGFNPNNKEEYKTSNRGIISEYIKKLLPDSYIVLSEQMWDEHYNENIDLLLFEEFLAEVSDAIILFTESPGSFCELGAFAYADNLFSDKLIVVLDEKYRDSKSFISTGPVLKAKSDGSKVIYAPLDNGALLSSAELRNEILELVNRIQSKKSKINKRTINRDKNYVQISSFIIEILELLRIVQPINSNDLLQLYKTVKQFDRFNLVKRDGSNFKREIKFNYILKLLKMAGIIEVENSVIRFPHYEKTQHLMLKYYGNAIECERNRIICKKYRYREQI